MSQRSGTVAQRDSRSILIIEDPDILIFALSKLLEPAVEWEGAMTDFFQDGLKEDDGSGEQWRFDEVHLMKEDVGVGEDIVTLRVLGMLSMAGWRETRLLLTVRRTERTGADPARDIVSKVALTQH